MKKEKAKKNEAHEEEAIYRRNTLHIFHSFEEANEYDSKEMASFTPEEHLRHVTLLLQHIFSEEVNKAIDKKIHFKKAHFLR
jgi:hypothetical protein